MDTMHTPYTKPPVARLFVKRVLGWLVMTAQFLLKKNPDLRW